MQTPQEVLSPRPFGGNSWGPTLKDMYEDSLLPISSYKTESTPWGGTSRHPRLGPALLNPVCTTFSFQHNIDKGIYRLEWSKLQALWHFQGSARFLRSTANTH